MRRPSTSIVATLVALPILVLAADALACTYVEESYIQSLTPAIEATEVGLDVPLTLRWEVVGGENPFGVSDFPALTGSLTELTAKVAAAGSDAEHPVTVTLDATGQAVVTPDEPWVSETEYSVSLTLKSDYGSESSVTSTFTTGSRAQTSPAAERFGGISKITLTQRAAPSYSCCPEEFVGQCGYDRDCIQSGWSYPEVVDLAFDGLDHPELGASAYRYIVYQGASVESAQRLSSVLSPEGSLDLSVRLDHVSREPCFRIVAQAWDGTTLDGESTGCVSEDELIEIEPREAPAPATLECSTSQDDGTSDDDTSDDAETGAEVDPGSESGDDVGCSSAGSKSPAPGPIALFVGLLGLALRRRHLEQCSSSPSRTSLRALL